MLKVAVIIGSTRPGRKAEAVARWVYDIASKRRSPAASWRRRATDEFSMALCFPFNVLSFQLMAIDV